MDEIEDMRGAGKSEDEIKEKVVTLLMALSMATSILAVTFFEDAGADGFGAKVGEYVTETINQLKEVTDELDKTQGKGSAWDAR